MSRQGRVLVVEDLARWRAELVEILQRGGFYAEAVATAEEALRRLETSFYHVMILDVRLDEGDQSNIDGWKLLQELDSRGLNEPVKLVMLSAHDSKEQIRAAFTEYKVVDFLAKHKFNNLAFLEHIRRIFDERLHINLSLDINWQQVSGPEALVVNLELEDGQPVGQGTPLQNLLAQELDDLLCRLFSQAESVLVRPMVRGRSGAGVLWAQQFLKAGGGRAVVVKFGSPYKIEQEYQNFKEHAEPYIGGLRSTTIRDMRRTPRLGGLLYALVGSAADQPDTFGGFYRRANVSQIVTALERLFTETCGSWYANPGRLQPHKLTDDYLRTLKLSREKLEQALQELPTVQGTQHLSFSSLAEQNRTFPNPIRGALEQSFVLPTYVCTTHGDFNPGNLLVDRDSHIWMIDFQGTRPGHMLRDLAELDSCIRFQLLAPESATLAQRLAMEEALCSIGHFADVERLPSLFSSDNPELARTYEVVVFLRSLARRLIRHNPPEDDMSEYYVALLYNALNIFRFRTLHTLQREHALLSAALLAARLGAATATD